MVTTIQIFSTLRLYVPLATSEIVKSPYTSITTFFVPICLLPFIILTLAPLAGSSSLSLTVPEILYLIASNLFCKAVFSSPSGNAVTKACAAVLVASVLIDSAVTTAALTSANSLTNISASVSIASIAVFALASAVAMPTKSVALSMFVFPIDIDDANQCCY